MEYFRNQFKNWIRMQKRDGILYFLIWPEGTQMEKYHKKLFIYYSMRNYVKLTEKQDFNFFYWTGNYFIG